MSLSSPLSSMPCTSRSVRTSTYAWEKSIIYNIVIISNKFSFYEQINTSNSLLSLAKLCLEVQGAPSRTQSTWSNCTTIVRAVVDWSAHKLTRKSSWTASSGRKYHWSRCQMESPFDRWPDVAHCNSRTRDSVEAAIRPADRVDTPRAQVAVANLLEDKQIVLVVLWKIGILKCIIYQFNLKVL